MNKLLESVRNSIRRETSGAAIPFIAFGAALNLSLGQIAGLLKLPVYLDSIGTVLVAVLCGPWAAVISGSIANTIGSITFSPPSVFFIPTVLIIGVFTGIVAKHGAFRRWYTAFPLGVVQGLLAATVSAPISAYLFSGITLSGMDFLVMFFRATGKSILLSTFLQGLVADPLDKAVTYTVAWFIVRRLPRRIVIRFPRYENVLPVSG